MGRIHDCFQEYKEKYNVFKSVISDIHIIWRR